MSRNRLWLIPTLCLMSQAASASSFAPALDLAMKVWPKATTVAVACNYALHEKAVAELGRAAKERNLQLRVVNVSDPSETAAATRMLTSKAPDFLILLEEDALLGGKGTKTQSFLSSLSAVGVAALGSSEASLAAGAVAAVVDGQVRINQPKAKALRLTIPG